MVMSGRASEMKERKRCGRGRGNGVGKAGSSGAVGRVRPPSLYSFQFPKFSLMVRRPFQPPDAGDEEASEMKARHGPSLQMHQGDEAA